MKFLGRSEKINLIDLQVDNLSCKIDTGAFGNALHCDEVKVVDDKLLFSIGDKNFVFEKYKTIIVKSSFGKKQKRFLIFTRLKLGDSIYKIYLSLTNRKNMKHPMLIGRRFLHKFNYIVDVKEKNTYDRVKKV